MKNRELTLRERLRRIPAVLLLTTLGATGVTACTTEIRVPAPPVTAPADPGEQAPSVDEAAPAATPDVSETAEPVHETDITTSDIFNAMTTADQELVEKASKLTYDEFLLLKRDDRAKTATVLADVHVDYLIDALPLVDPGFTPDVAKQLYVIGTESTPDAIKAAPTAPLIQGWNRELTARRLAATGQPSLLEDALKITAGSAFFVGPQDNMGVDHKTNGFLEMISSLKRISASGTDTDKLYPIESMVTDHTSAKNYSYAANLSSPDLEGKTQYNIRGTVITLANGTEIIAWTKHSSTKVGDPGYSGAINNPDL